MAQEKQERPVKDKLLAQIMALNEADDKKVLKTRARRTKIRKEFVGHTLAVFNGQDYTRVHITPEMEGRTLAKVAPRITPTAQAKFLSIPPRKMRQVAALIKGLPAEKALGILNFTPKIAAQHMAQTLKSAVANKLSLEGTDRLNPEDLHVHQIVVSAGPIAKRIRYRSMGRVYRIRKRYCHLAIYLSEKPGTVQPVAAKPETTKAAGAVKPKNARSAAKSAAGKSTKKAAGKASKKTAARGGAKKKTATKKSTTAKKAVKADKPKADTKKK